MMIIVNILILYGLERFGIFADMFGKRIQGVAKPVKDTHNSVAKCCRNM